MTDSSPSCSRFEAAIREGLIFKGIRLHDSAVTVLVGRIANTLREIDGEDLERLASAAFEWDTRNGHHSGGPWTWHMIGDEGQENYRGLVRAVIAELVEAAA